MNLSIERRFLNELNTYLEYPLSQHGERKVETMLQEYKHQITFRLKPKQVKISIPLKSLTPDGIAELICETYGITPSDLISHSRKQNITFGRHVFCYLVYKYLSYSMSAIGKYLGGRDHTTILNSIRIVNNMCLTDMDFRARIIALEGQVEEHLN